MSSHKSRPFTREELSAYLSEIFPQIWTRGDYAIEEVRPMGATVRLSYHPDHLTRLSQLGQAGGEFWGWKRAKSESVQRRDFEIRL